MDTASLTKAFEGSTANARRIKTVTLNIPAVNGAKAYEVTLPTSFLSSADNSKAVAINTGIASVTLPGNMLTTADAADAQSISLTIAVGDKKQAGGGGSGTNWRPPRHSAEYANQWPTEALEQCRRTCNGNLALPADG